MQYRDVDILAEKTVGDSGTETIDLDVTDPITELSIIYGLTNGGSALDDDAPTETITKIEIVDGGTVYASLSGPELAAVFAYETGLYPPHWYTEVASVGQSVTLPIRFGRFLGDPVRNFDPTRLRNPQLKVTWGKLSGHATTTVTLGVRAKVMDGVAPAASCLLTKAVREFTTASSGVESTELPTEYPIRRLFVRPRIYGSYPETIINNLRLDCDEGKFIAFDLSGWELAEEVYKTFGHFHVRRMLYCANAKWREAYLGNVEGVQMGSGAANSVASGMSSGNMVYQVKLLVSGSESATETTIEAVAYGALPENTYVVPFGLPDDPATWFNAAAYRKVKLNLTQGEASATCSILVQQDRPL